MVDIKYPYYLCGRWRLKRGCKGRRNNTARNGAYTVSRNPCLISFHYLKQLNGQGIWDTLYVSYVLYVKSMPDLPSRKQYSLGFALRMVNHLLVDRFGWQEV